MSNNSPFFGNAAQVSTNRLDGDAKDTGGSYTGTTKTSSSGALDRIKAIAHNALHPDSQDTGDVMNQPDEPDVGNEFNQPDEPDVGNGLNQPDEPDVGQPLSGDDPQIGNSPIETIHKKQWKKWKKFAR